MDLLPPFRSDLPRWLVCLDLQRGTGVDASAEALCNGALILQQGRSAGWKVVHVHRCFRGADYGPPPMRGLEPAPDESLLYRSELSAFSNRKFVDLIESQPPAQIALVSSDVSAALSTALSAVEHGHRISLLQIAQVDRHIFSAFRHLLKSLSAGDLHLVEPVSIPESRLRLVEKAV